MREIKKSILEKAKSLGFDAAGVATAAPDPADQRHLDAYLGAGLQGDMDWMARHADRRADPQTLWPDAKSIIALGLNYGPAQDPRRALDRRDRGNISVYAQGSDYHDLVKKRLKALARWMVETYGCEVKVFVDTAPVMEKPLAARAGIGWQGKHTNLVSREYGSWLFLGEIFTTLELPPDQPETDHCGSCTACLDACPTGALTAPYRIDPRRCVSYLSIELKGPIPEDLRAGLGNRIYGCDDCLAACPFNKFETATGEDTLKPRPELAAPRLADLARLNDGDFRAVFAGTAVKRTGRNRIVRNVLTAMGNSGDSSLADAVRERLDDSSALVRDAAAWALGKITKN